MEQVTDMIEIELNGAPHRVAPGQSLHELMAGLALHRQTLAVAVNRAVVPRQRWPEYILRLGDKVDIVRAIGGG